jgi:hypothetical protein
MYLIDKILGVALEVRGKIKKGHGAGCYCGSKCVAVTCGFIAVFRRDQDD